MLFRSRLDALQAVVLLEKLKHLDAWTKGRQANAAFYDERFAAAGIASQMRTPVARPGRHIYNQYVIRCARRDELRQYLGTQGIGTEIYYPVPFHRQLCFEDVTRPDAAYPVADRAAETSLALPIYGELSPAQQDYVVASIGRFVANS